MALVALDSAADPVKLQQKLQRRWFKTWAISFNKQQKTEENRNVKPVEDELRKALHIDKEYNCCR